MSPPFGSKARSYRADPGGRHCQVGSLAGAMLGCGWEVAAAADTVARLKPAELTAA